MSLDLQAFPGRLDNDKMGLTKREYAAIQLRVPDSGNDELDKMINYANKRNDYYVIMAAKEREKAMKTIIDYLERNLNASGEAGK